MIREVNATDGMDMLVITGKNNYQRNDANTVEPQSRGAVVWLAAVVCEDGCKKQKTQHHAATASVLETCPRKQTNKVKVYHYVS